MHYALELLMTQVSSHFEAEIRNRELAVERRRRSPSEGIPMELWQGQIAALERSLAMARLKNTEAISLIQEFGAGRLTMPQPQPRSILLALVDDI